jgi:hypothetical protein
VKLLLAFSGVGIVTSFVVVGLIEIAGIGSIDSCNGCDPTPWATGVERALSVLFVVWLLAVVAYMAVRLRRPDKPGPRKRARARHRRLPR